LMHIAAGNPGPRQLTRYRLRTKLLGIEVSGCHLIPAICEPAAVGARQGWAAMASVM